MKAVLIELMCLPPVPVIRTIVRHSRLYIEGSENYQKRSFRNRIYLNGPQGRTLFSIPLLKGKNEQMPIREVRIAYDNPWLKILLKQIKSCYGSAPFYDFFFEEIVQILNAKPVFLFDLNYRLWNWVREQLGLEIDTLITDTYIKEVEPTIADFRGVYKPGTVFFNMEETKVYNQVFTDKHGFIPHLSVLDLMMCLGPEAKLML